MSRAERLALIDRHDPALPVTRQCGLMTVSRASVYRPPAPASEEDLAIMALIDRQYLARPYYGSPRMAAWLATQGHPVNRKRVQRLMRLIGLVAVYQRPNTSQPAAAHKVYPDRLGGLSIDRVNQVWCSDITPAFAGAGSISRWPRGSCIWSRSWTGTVVRYWPGGCRTRSAPISASRRSRKRALVLVGRRSSTPTRACPRESGGQPVYQRRLHRRAEPAPGHD